MNNTVNEFVALLIVIDLFFGCLAGTGWVFTQNHTDQDTGIVTAMKETAD